MKARQHRKHTQLAMCNWITVGRARWLRKLPNYMFISATDPISYLAWKYQQPMHAAIRRGFTFEQVKAMHAQAVATKQTVMLLASVNEFRSTPVKPIMVDEETGIGTIEMPPVPLMQPRTTSYLKSLITPDTKA